MEQITYLIGNFSNTKFINSFVKLINCETEIISFNRSTKKDLRLVASRELVNQIAQFLVFYLKEPVKILSIPSNNQWHLNQLELVNENEEYTIKNIEISTLSTSTLEDLNIEYNLHNFESADNSKVTKTQVITLSSNSVLKINASLFKLIMPLYGYNIDKTISSGNSSLYFVSNATKFPTGFRVSIMNDFDIGDKFYYAEIRHLLPNFYLYAEVILKENVKEVLKAAENPNCLFPCSKYIRLNTLEDTFKHINQFNLYLMNESEAFIKTNSIIEFDPLEFYEEITDSILEKLSFRRILTDEIIIPGGQIVYKSDDGSELLFYHPNYYDHYGRFVVRINQGDSFVFLGTIVKELYNIEMETFFLNRDEYYQNCTVALNYLIEYLINLEKKV